MHKIRKFFTLGGTVKGELKELGLDPGVVQQDIMKTIYKGFRDVGCRTSLWDGQC